MWIQKIPTLKHSWPNLSFFASKIPHHTAALGLHFPMERKGISKRCYRTCTESHHNVYLPQFILQQQECGVLPEFQRETFLKNPCLFTI